MSKGQETDAAPNRLIREPLVFARALVWGSAVLFLASLLLPAARLYYLKDPDPVIHSGSGYGWLNLGTYTSRFYKEGWAFGLDCFILTLIFAPWYMVSNICLWGAWIVTYAGAKASSYISGFGLAIAALNLTDKRLGQGHQYTIGVWVWLSAFAVAIIAGNLVRCEPPVLVSDKPVRRFDP